jgi:hypothetical protein
VRVGGGGEQAVDSPDGVWGAHLARSAGDGEGHREDATFELGGEVGEPPAKARG